MKFPKQLSAFEFYKLARGKNKKGGRQKNPKRRKSVGDDPSSVPEFDEPQSSTSKRTFGQLEEPFSSNKRVRFAEDEFDGHQSDGTDGTDGTDATDTTDASNDNTLNEKRERTFGVLFKDKVTKKSADIPNKKTRRIESILKHRQSYSLDDLRKSPFISSLDVPSKKAQEIPIRIQKEPDEDAKSTRSFSIPPFLTDSREQAKKCFQWLINPYDVDRFMSVNWEKEPLLLKRNKPNYYHGVYSTADLDRALRERHLQFTKNIDITSYINDERKTYNPDGRAYPAVVWDHFQVGCSIRLLNPQTYSRSVWKLNSILQEFFGSYVGANVYLTPAGSQGFAPHYDDIEAFVLQLEGRKLWKVYPPLDEANTLPRFSSKNFKRDELKAPPILTVELEPGDMLYFPRGFIHEAQAVEGEHSLHITLSAAQKNTYGDLLEIMLPVALQTAMEEDKTFRESLPTNYLQYMGVVHQDDLNSNRDVFVSKVKNLMTKLISHINVDSAVDQMSKRMLRESLPPVLTAQEKRSSIHGSGEFWDADSATVEGGIELAPETSIRLLRYGIVRLVMEEDAIRLYHNMENSYDPNQEIESQYVEIDSNLAPAIDYLVKNYPNYVEISSLPLEKLDEKLEISNLLFDKGLITIVEEGSDSE
ncbi:ribosomal oxygenase 1 [Tetranychus urticae]|uniref:Bifunctional lysine-specific demethylase and histidyl-hydroxylase n=1 Tax=Tetranychus urticae TaxID=32264 RepID=T1JPQ4_TETUR|nr:ribosomal oxygenase 1 [Tetranychus urticae]